MRAQRCHRAAQLIGCRTPVPQPATLAHAIRLHTRVTRSFPVGHKRSLFAGKPVVHEQSRNDGAPPRGTGARADMHCHSTASQVSKLGVQRALGPAGVRHASGGGLRARQAARHGLRDDHRPRHDRRRACDRRSPRRVRLRGAHRPLPRRGAGGARALLRHHRRGPRMAAGAQRRRRAVRRLPARARDRVRARAPLLHRRRAARQRATAAALPSCSASGRCATARARRELNRPAATYVATRDGIGVGGSDDHAGVDIGRTFTEAPRAAHAPQSSSRTCAPGA